MCQLHYLAVRNRLFILQNASSEWNFGGRHIDIQDSSIARRAGPVDIYISAKTTSQFVRVCSKKFPSSEIFTQLSSVVLAYLVGRVFSSITKECTSIRGTSRLSLTFLATPRKHRHVKGGASQGKQYL